MTEHTTTAQTTAAHTTTGQTTAAHTTTAQPTTGHTTAEDTTIGQAQPSPTSGTDDNTTDRSTPHSTDHNIWPGLTYDDPMAARAWLSALGFREGVLVRDDDGSVHHSEMIWPEGGRVMISSAGRADPTFASPRGSGSVYVVTDDPDAVHARARDLGAAVLRGMEDTDYGSRGFSIADAEGNRWSFGTYAGEG